VASVFAKNSHTFISILALNHYIVPPFNDERPDKTIIKLNKKGKHAPF
jgi:hypothetical protein